MKLIDKDVLIAEIEKHIDEIYAGRPFDSLSSEQQTALWYIKSIMSSINNLEVKEVDLEKEIISTCRSYRIREFSGAELNKHDIEWVAKHFFELGLKAKNK